MEKIGGLRCPPQTGKFFRFSGLRSSWKRDLAAETRGLRLCLRALLYIVAPVHYNVILGSRSSRCTTMIVMKKFPSNSGWKSTNSNPKMLVCDLMRRSAKGWGLRGIFINWITFMKRYSLDLRSASSRDLSGTVPENTLRKSIWVMFMSMPCGNGRSTPDLAVEVLRRISSRGEYS